jgi:hypothetical protein
MREEAQTGVQRQGARLDDGGAADVVPLRPGEAGREGLGLRVHQQVRVLAVHLRAPEQATLLHVSSTMNSQPRPLFSNHQSTGESVEVCRSSAT